jgi:hypothetical protein
MQVCRKQGLTDTGLSKREGEILLAKFPDEETIRTNKQVADYLTGDKICTPENVEVQMRTIYNECFSPENCKDPPDFQGEIGQKRDPFFQAWLKRKYQEYSPVTRRSESDSLSATPAIAAALDWRRRFQELIDIKTESFVGRKYVFDKIEDFLTNRDRGYFTIEGDPGMGKSSILAEYVRGGECVAHFNEHLGGINRTSQYLESICTQLIAKYGLPYSELPPDANQDNAFLVKLLQQISDQLKPGERLVIVVDALDEVDIDSQDKSKNILYLPRYLPKNVFFVMTRRRGIDFLFVVDTPKYLFDLMAEEYAERSLQDVQTFIRQHVNEHERLRRWIDAKELTVEDFITQLADKSENNFMYLRCVLVDIEDGIYQDATIESLPQGLEAYYEDHWQRMGMTTEPLPRTKIRIVYILSETPKPIPYDEIVYYIKYTGEPEAELTVQEVLDQWKQFLHKQREYQQTFYRLYHDSFRRFLNRKDIVEKAGIAIKEIKGLMADSIWQDLLGDG